MGFPELFFNIGKPNAYENEQNKCKIMKIHISNINTFFFLLFLISDVVKKIHNLNEKRY